jgi:hypothetical protein
MHWLGCVTMRPNVGTRTWTQPHPSRSGPQYLPQPAVLDTEEVTGSPHWRGHSLPCGTMSSPGPATGRFATFSPEANNPLIPLRGGHRKRETRHSRQPLDVRSVRHTDASILQIPTRHASRAPTASRRDRVIAADLLPVWGGSAAIRAKGQKCAPPAPGQASTCAPLLNADSYVLMIMEELEYSRPSLPAWP